MGMRWFPVQSPQLPVPDEGASGPQPHPNFIEVSCEAALSDRHWALEGARKDASCPTHSPVMFVLRTTHLCCRRRAIWSVRGNLALPDRPVEQDTANKPHSRQQLAQSSWTKRSTNAPAIVREPPIEGRQGSIRKRLD
jgi:hypothetical protein